MATQEWTIIAIVGAALPEVESRLAKWSAARTDYDPHAWSARDWPASIARSASRFFDLVSDNRFSPPVAYWSRHVDLWSSFGELYRFLPSGPPHVAYSNACVWSYRLPDRGRLVRRARTARNLPYFQESIWLANAIDSAATAYKGLWDESLILIHRRALTTSPSDEELLARASRPSLRRRGARNR